MRVLLYPHSMEVGGSQLNAIELAGAVRDRGHDVVVYSEPGALLDKVADLGLPHLERRDSAIRPGPATALDLRRIVAARGIDVVHGWEWPPILEAFAACGPGGRGSVVGSVMSMSVAPFIPAGVPLTVGTQRILADRRPSHRGPLVLLEPPVDTAANAPDTSYGPVPGVSPDAGVLTVAIVSRLAPELKLEGILTAVRTVGRLARRFPIRLVVTGDGPAREAVTAAAAAANEGLDRPAVVLTGQLDDPRPVYASADVCIAMGGSALRALAFAKPLVVQGEGGFFRTLTPETLDGFLTDGWYGVDDRGPDAAEVNLSEQLLGLASDPELRGRLGRLGRELVVERFSLEAGARSLEDLYSSATASRQGVARWSTDATRSAAGLVGYKVERRRARRRGTASTDDFNARPV